MPRYSKLDSPSHLALAFLLCSGRRCVEIPYHLKVSLTDQTTLRVVASRHPSVHAHTNITTGVLQGEDAGHRASRAAISKSVASGEWDVVNRLWLTIGLEW